MKKIFTTTRLWAIAMMMLTAATAGAIDNNTVEIVYNGTTATVTIADNISSYVTCTSGTSSHVVLTQSTDFAGVDATIDNEDGEIIYSLSGTSADGEFYMTGAYKCTVELNGLTLTNTAGPAINVQNGKRVALSAKKGTTNTLTDAPNETYNGCFHCKGHTKLKGKGTLNVIGNSKHAIYSKEYIEVKNLTLNITVAQKDAIHCKEYFLMESGTVNISSATDDGIQVELGGLTATEATDANHTDEDTGNFYMTGGTLAISGYNGKAVKTDGTISITGGTQKFDTTDVTENAIAGIENVTVSSLQDARYYDLQGRTTDAAKPGLKIVTDGKANARKVMVTR